MFKNGEVLGNMYDVVAEMFTVHSTGGMVFTAIYLIDVKNPEWGWELEVNEDGDVYIVDYEPIPNERKATRNGIIPECVETYGKNNVATHYLYKAGREAWYEKLGMKKWNYLMYWDS